MFPKISAVLIVKNAEKTLLECLQSLKYFDEIVILENGSTDNTLQVIESFKKKFQNIQVYTSEFIGFGPLKNLAISYAKNEWIFSIDSDEALDEKSLGELEKIQWSEKNIIAIPRKNLYGQKWIKACGWYPDFVFRFFNKNFTRFNENLVHESVILPQGSAIIHLKIPLKHYAYDNIAQLLGKMDKYSTLWAEQNVHKNNSIFKALLHAYWSFFRNYFLKKGVLYGYEGFIISLCNALGVFFKYAKLYEKKKKL